MYFQINTLFTWTCKMGQSNKRKIQLMWKIENLNFGGPKAKSSDDDLFPSNQSTSGIRFNTMVHQCKVMINYFWTQRWRLCFLITEAPADRSTILNLLTCAISNNVLYEICGHVWLSVFQLKKLYIFHPNLWNGMN